MNDQCVESGDDEKRRTKPSKYFVFLMVNNLPDIKTNTYVDMSTTPRRRFVLLNSGRIKNVRNTKPAQGKWQLNMIIGPFNDKKKAKSVMEFWRNKSRGMKSRRNRGDELAMENNVICWDTVMDGGGGGGGDNGEKMNESEEEETITTVSKETVEKTYKSRLLPPQPSSST